MRHRHAAVAPLALLLLALVAAPVSAGGVAVVIPTPDDGGAVTAGQATTVGFTLLQHGVTPVDFGVATVVFTATSTGEQFRATAKPLGKAGEFEASFTYPTGGFWTWHVEHDGLLVESAPISVGVFETDGQMPAFYPDGYEGGASISLADQLSDVQGERDVLRRQLDELRAATATSTSALAEAQARPTTAMLVVGILAAAVLGILGGVGLTLATGSSRQPRVREITAPMPQKVD